MKQFRQGDVYLVEENPPKNAKRVPRSGVIILAEGEATGHSHTVSDPSCELLEGDSGERWLAAPKEVEVNHQEHETVTLPPGNYRVIRQREYSPQEIRQVRD